MPRCRTPIRRCHDFRAGASRAAPAGEAAAQCGEAVVPGGTDLDHPRDRILERLGAQLHRRREVRRALDDPQPREDASANLVVAQLVFLEAEDPDADIRLYVNSPGGSAYAGMAIYDAMQYVKPDVQTYCVGMAMSAAAMILAGGAAGKRYVLPNAKVMIHQGSGGFRGTPADIQIAAKEILSLTRRYAEIIAAHARRDVEQVLHDIDRDRFLSPEEAVAYGLADRVLAVREQVAAG